MSTQFWIQMLTYAVSIGCMYGALSTRLKVLEKKVDCHNHLIERMYEVESDIKLIKERISYE